MIEVGEAIIIFALGACAVIVHDELHYGIAERHYRRHWCLNQVMEGSYECEVCNPDP